MFGTCAVGGCDKPSNMLDNRCRYHSVIESARQLGATEYDRLRETLKTTAPVTRDEQNASSARHALRSIEWQARDLKRSKVRARKSGATEAQIAEAVKRGKDGVL